MKAIYEESSGSYEDAPDEVSVTVLKAEYSDPPATPRYLVVLDSFNEALMHTVRWDRHDFEVIRWAQAEYDKVKARWQ